MPESIDMTLVVVAKDGADMAAFHREYTHNVRELISIVNHDNHSIAFIANRYLAACMSAVFGVCHADANFGPGALRALFACASSGAVCGIVGQTNTFREPHNLVWCSEWQNPSASQIEAGWPAHPSDPCPVSTLDCCCVVLPTALGLRFDEETFDSFHCYAEDLCIQAHSRGIPVLVPPANAGHLCPNVNGPNWGTQRDVYYWRLKEKWPHVDFSVIR